MKAFSMKSFVDFTIKSLKEMDIKDVETAFNGMRLFTKIVDNYMKEHYGSCKRHSDLHEYCYILGETLMAKYYEINKKLIEDENKDVF